MSRAPEDPEALAHLEALLFSVAEASDDPVEVLNALFLMGIPAERLLLPALRAWNEGPERIQALRKLAHGGLEPSPMVELLVEAGFSSLAARCALRLWRPDWEPFLEVPGVDIQAEGIEVLLGGRNYRLPSGALDGAHFILEGSPRSRGLDSAHNLTLMDISRPRRLGIVRAPALTLVGRTPLPVLGAETPLFFHFSTLLRLPRGLRAGTMLFHGCSRLRALPRGWSALMVSIAHCPRLVSIPAPVGRPFGLHLKGLRRLVRLGSGACFWTLTLDQCALARMPAGLRLDGNLEIRDCPRLRELGPGTMVGGDLVLKGVPRLRSLPPDLVVRGQVLWDRFSGSAPDPAPGPQEADGWGLPGSGPLSGGPPPGDGSAGS